MFPSKDVRNFVVSSLTAKSILIGFLYGLVWNGLWVVSTAFETISSTVSWYLPAAFRLFFLLVSPYRFWFSSQCCQHVLFVVLVSVFPFPNFENYLNDLGIWIVISFFYSCVIFMGPVWWYRRERQFPYVDQIQQLFMLLVLAITSSTLMGVFIFTRLGLFGSFDGADFVNTMFAFVVGDFVGILVALPSFLLLSATLTNHKEQLNLDGIVFCSIVWLVATLCFGWLTTFSFTLNYQTKYLAIIISVILAYRYHWQGAAISSLFIGVIAFISALKNDATPLEHEFYVVSVSITTLFIGAASTQLKSINKQLNLALTHSRQLADQLITVQEAERKQLSRDLHDDFGHRIVDLKLQVSAVRHPNCDLTRQCKLLSEKLDELYDAMKLSIESLRPVGIDSFSLETVVEHSSVASTLRKSALRFEVIVIGTSVSLPAKTKISAYRIIQEALTNCVKHAKASHVEVTFEYRIEHLAISVKDNGVGIAKSQSSEDSLGMISMRERARHIGSDLTVDSSPQGTQIRFVLQLVE